MKYSSRLIEKHSIKGLFVKMGHILGKPPWDGTVPRGWKQWRIVITQCLKRLKERQVTGRQREFLSGVITGAVVFSGRTEPNHSNLAKRYYLTSIFTSEFQMVSLIGQTTYWTQSPKNTCLVLM